MALLAGVLGGVFGIGGGMLISPLLLQIGIGPEVSSPIPNLICAYKKIEDIFAKNAVAYQPANGHGMIQCIFHHLENHYD